ncbi:hypothetical protein HU200_036531 [Digitaria exilis]|uniref:Uncharacterized protein n=1 Tax=Digitaria exilis TaxID=1010633 RepID=A0A835BSA4_9POAL|nr:hypothetical protein HU200_036531 [Digitaria exilis]
MFITGPRRTTRPLPPSPPWLPLIGHVHLVGALPHVSLRRLAERYGGLMTLRLGVVPTLVASSTRAAQAVLRAHDRCFASRPSSVCGDVLSYGRLGIALAPYGEGWRQAKKLAITHLLNASKVQSYRAAREEEVALVISKIRGAAATGTAVDMSELLSKFTSDMVCRAVAGRSFRVEGRDRVFRELIDESNALLAGFNLDNLYPGLATAAGGVLVRSARTKAERVWERWDRMIDKQIDEHATVLHEDQDCDFIHMLLSLQEEYGLTRDAIKAIVVVSPPILCILRLNNYFVDKAFSIIIHLLYYTILLHGTKASRMLRVPKNSHVNKKKKERFGSLDFIDLKVYSSPKSPCLIRLAID